MLTLCSHEVDFLCWRRYAIHLPFKVRKTMAEVGLLPKRIMSARDPRCHHCLKCLTVKSLLVKQKSTKTNKSVLVQVVESKSFASFDFENIIQLNGPFYSDPQQHVLISVSHHSDFVHVNSYLLSKEVFRALEPGPSICTPCIACFGWTVE